MRGLGKGGRNSAMLSVPLSDPSCYAPVMDYLKNMAEDVEQDGNDYCVLLLITDGGIAGMMMNVHMHICQHVHVFVFTQPEQIKFSLHYQYNYTTDQK